MVLNMGYFNLAHKPDAFHAMLQHDECPVVEVLSEGWRNRFESL
jgi:hypothetical protein